MCSPFSYVIGCSRIINQERPRLAPGAQGLARLPSPHDKISQHRLRLQRKVD